MIPQGGICENADMAKNVAPIARPKTEYLAPEAQKALANRLARIEGHVKAVRRMVLEKKCADEILLQVSAVKAALNQFTASMLDHELQVCLHSCMEGTGDDRLEKVTRVLTTLLKQS